MWKLNFDISLTFLLLKEPVVILWMDVASVSLGTQEPGALSSALKDILDR